MTLLGGRFGVPDYESRIYVGVDALTLAEGSVLPRAIHWPDGRGFEIAACGTPGEAGRWELGNLVMWWDVELAGGARRRIFWERGRWFVPRPQAVDRNGERAPGEPR